MVIDVDTGTLTINKAYSDFNGENGLRFMPPTPL
jgi:hypothetical protein